jgi:hypothetical protein
MDRLADASGWAVMAMQVLGLTVGLGSLIQAVLTARKHWHYVDQMSRHEKGSGLLILTFSLFDVYLLIPLMGWPAVTCLYGLGARYFVRESVRLAEAGRIGYLYGEEPPWPDEEE